ncbi:MAG: PmoA family protein [Planctomycetota bacterium]|nr:PmoA family protein [Planctomycetota bacterium]MDA1137988.1 PmoA family protein [Planctomycetota bacterium]
MKTIITTSFLCALLQSSSIAEEGLKDVPGDHLDVLRAGKAIARYMYAYDKSTKDTRHNTYKPFLHVMDEEGKEPITKGPGGQYTHHRGIFLGWSKVGFQGKNYDMWHMNLSEIVHKEFLEQAVTEDTTVVKVRLHWLASADTVMIDEVRTFTFHHTDKDAHLLLDFHSVLTAPTDDVSLNGDPEHAGMHYRPHNDVAGNKSAKYVFHKEGANAQKDRDWPWAAMTYNLKDKFYTVQHMNHPDNPKGTRYSAYRDYGRFGAFSVSTLKKGESLTLQYRVRVQPGEAPERDVFAAQYQSYIKH